MLFASIESRTNIWWNFKNVDNKTHIVHVPKTWSETERLLHKSVVYWVCSLGLLVFCLWLEMALALWCQQSELRTLTLIRSCFSSGRRYWKSQGVSRGQNNRISDIVRTATTSAECWGQEKIFGKIQVWREHWVLIDFVMHEQTLHYRPGVFWVVIVSDTQWNLSGF